MAWEDLDHDTKVRQLIDVLTLTAVGAVELVKANQYTDAKALAKDVAGRMRLDRDVWFPLIDELRKAGRIPTADEIKQKAESLVDLSADEMRKAVADYSQEVHDRMK